MAAKVPKATRDELHRVLSHAILMANSADKRIDSVEGEVFVLKLTFYTAASIVLGCGLAYALGT